MTKHNSPSQENNFREISFQYILIFLVKTYKIISITMLAGLALASIYLHFSTFKYQANAHVEMARIPDLGGGSNSWGVVIEEPKHLIFRLTIKRDWDSNVLTNCTEDKQSRNERVSLADVIKISLVKDVGNVVLLQATSSSNDKAKSCVQAVFDYIKQSQDEMLNSKKKDLLNKISLNSRMLENHQKEQSISKGLLIDQNTISIGLAMRQIEVITRIQNELLDYQNLVDNYNKFPAKMMDGITENNIAISTKIKVVLFLGLLFGLFVGVTLGLLREFRETIKRSFTIIDGK